MSRRPLRYGIVGLAVLLVAVVALLPAKTLALATRDVEGLALRSVSGTLWRGEAGVRYRGHDLGHASWQLRPAAVLEGALSVTWQLRHLDYELFGKASRDFRAAAIVVSGAVSSAAANRLFDAYDIRIGGDFSVDAATVRFGESVPEVSGDVLWAGGPVHYRLSGEAYDETLPPMRAVLGSSAGEATASVAGQDGGRLIDARIDADGWLHIALTRRFTAMAGQSFAGDGAPDAVVLQVSEQLFGKRR